MRRRDFVTLVGGAAAAWPLATLAQSKMPVIGYLAGGSPNKPFIAAFHVGLKDGGFDESQNVAIETRFANEKVAALLVATGAFFGTRTQSIVALAARYSLPAIYDRREFTDAGGLVSYGTRFADVFRQGGIYTARILKGAKPADLPVLEPTKFEMVINIKTAKALGLKVPWQLQQLADEVIE